MQVYRAINNYLDQRSLWNLERVSEPRQSDGLEVFFVAYTLHKQVVTENTITIHDESFIF
jgi:hypothetical protein